MEISQVPIIDISSLVARTGNRDIIANQIQQACCESGFFYIVGQYSYAWFQPFSIEYSTS